MKLYAMSLRESLFFLFGAIAVGMIGGFSLAPRTQNVTAREYVVMGIPASIMADKNLDSVSYSLTYFPKHEHIQWRETAAVNRNGVSVSVSSDAPGVCFDKILRQPTSAK